MAHVIATINLKGGVAKTTTTVALAETLSVEFGRRVLVIDLDPQTNATTLLIGEARWGELNAREHTLARLFKDAVEPHDRRFDFAATLQRRVSDVTGAESIDLLPSSLDLIDVQDVLATISGGRFHVVNPIELLARAVKAHFDDYDLVLIDCPPNLGIVTLNGLRVAQGYIIPTIPDRLSTYGIPQIVRRVREFAEAIAEPIVPIGIIPTKVQAASSVHTTTLRELRSSSEAPVFDTVVRQANQVAAAAEFQTQRRTLSQKYGYAPSGMADTYVELARELLTRLEG